MSVADEHPTRGFGDDEREPLGPTGQPTWACTLTLSNGGARVTEYLHVRAATYDGAVKLCQEARLNITKVDATERIDPDGSTMEWPES